MRELLTARQMQALLVSPNKDGKAEADAADILATLLGHLKALYWFHWTAHWQTAGPQSYGDHLMFERMKDALVDEIDTLAEKTVGAFGAGVVDPWHIMKHEHEGMAPERTEGSHAATALRLERQFQLYLSHAYDTLKNIKLMSMGLDDFLMAMAGTHDTHVFLLQQRLGGIGTARQAGRRRRKAPTVKLPPGFEEKVKALGAESTHGAPAQDRKLHAIWKKYPDLISESLDIYTKAKQQALHERAQEELRSKGLNLPHWKSAVMNSLEKSWLGESTFAPHRHAENDDENELEAVWTGHACGPGGA